MSHCFGVEISVRLLDLVLRTIPRMLLLSANPWPMDQKTNRDDNDTAHMSLMFLSLANVNKMDIEINDIRDIGRIIGPKTRVKFVE